MNDFCFLKLRTPHDHLSVLDHMLRSPDQKWVGRRKESTFHKQMCCQACGELWKSAASIFASVRLSAFRFGRVEPDAHAPRLLTLSESKHAMTRPFST